MAVIGIFPFSSDSGVGEGEGGSNPSLDPNTSLSFSSDVILVDITLGFFVAATFTVGLGVEVGVFAGVGIGVDVGSDVGSGVGVGAVRLTVTGPDQSADESLALVYRPTLS